IGRQRYLRQRSLSIAQLIGIGACEAAIQRRQHFFIRRGELECAGQIAADGAAKWADVRRLYTETRLQETQYRRVIENLRVDPAATAPWGNHIQRDARAGTKHTSVSRGLARAARR